MDPRYQVLRNILSLAIGVLCFVFLFGTAQAAHAEVLVDLDEAGSFQAQNGAVTFKGSVWETSGLTIESVTIQTKTNPEATTGQSFGTTLSNLSTPAGAKKFTSNSIVTLETGITKYFSVTVKLKGADPVNYLVGSRATVNADRTISFVIVGSGKSDSSTWVMQSGQTGTGAGIDTTGTGSGTTTDTGITTTPPTMAAGITTSFTNEKRTETAYTADVTFTLTAPQTINVAVLYGEKPDAMTKTVALFLKGTTAPLPGYILLSSGKNDDYYVAIGGLDPQKEYYVALAKTGDLTTHYSTSQKIAPFTPAASTSTNAPGTLGGATNTSSSTGSTAGGTGPGGLVSCDGTPANPCRFDDMLKLVNTVLDFFIKWIIMPIFVIIIAYVGFLFLTSGGSPETLSKAKGIALKSLIGLVVILAAWLIVNTILTSLLRVDTGKEYNLLDSN